MKDNLKKNGIVVSCSDTGTSCAFASSIGGNSVTIEPSAMDPALCGPLSSSMLHEMVHAHGKDPGDPDTATHNTYDGNVPSANDKAYGCEKKCFNVGRGTAAACK